ncbi:MAG: AAA family ATPase, partial [Pirellulaceae bacterium]
MNRLDVTNRPGPPPSENGRQRSLSEQDVAAAIDRLYEQYTLLREQLAGVIVGMDEVSDQLLIGLLCRGHCMLQGMPGLAKT